MPQWRVRDVMTTEVIAASDDTSLAEIATTLADGRISGVPIVDRFDAIVGVVSWTDLRNKTNFGEPGDNAPVSWWRRLAPTRQRWAGGAALEVMSAPPVTIKPDASLPAAARMMHRRNVGRLLVTDNNGRLRGIVTRSDLLKVHARLDAVIRDEVMQRILRGTLRIEPGSVQVSVDDGAVTLTGRTTARTTALTAARLAEAVAGVTAVVDRLEFDIDDTIAAAGTSQPVDRGGQPDWRIGGHPARPVARAARDRPRSRYDEPATRSAVAR
jgi:CBS domain-containing protein